MTKKLPKPSARLTIDIWTDGARYKLPEDLPEALARHVEKVMGDCEMGCWSGEIYEESDKDRKIVGFRGWWKLEETTNAADHDLILAAQELFDAVEWTPSKLSEIAALLTSSGSPVRDLDGSL